MLSEVRNSEGRLVFKIDELKRTLEIILKGCVTLVKWKPNGKFEIINL